MLLQDVPRAWSATGCLCMLRRQVVASQLVEGFPRSQAVMLRCLFSGCLVQSCAAAELGGLECPRSVVSSGVPCRSLDWSAKHLCRPLCLACAVACGHFPLADAHGAGAAPCSCFNFALVLGFVVASIIHLGSGYCLVCSAVSGSCFNPAVIFGLEVANISLDSC
jgi:hypothetical protein